MQLITFQPTGSTFQALMEKYSDGEAMQTIQSVFYSELVSRAVQTVREMKQGKDEGDLITPQLLTLLWFRG